jgi:uncharacterized delta-60 repeat protein
MIRKVIIAAFLLSTLILSRHSILVNAFVLPPVASHLSSSTPDCVGKVITDFSPDWVTASDLALQPDGKYVAVGFIHSGSDARPLIVRYTATGEIDATFGVDGFVVTDLGHQSNFRAVKGQTDGTLDASFGAIVTDLGGSEAANGIAVQGDGKVIILGSSGYLQPGRFRLARLEANGALDMTFGVNGVTVTPFFT